MNGDITSSNDPARLMQTSRESSSGEATLYARAAGIQGASPGLVSNATSHTLMMDPHQARLKKNVTGSIWYGHGNSRVFTRWWFSLSCCIDHIDICTRASVGG